MAKTTETEDVTLSTEQVEKLSTGIKEGKEALDRARASMVEQNERVEKLLKERDAMAKKLDESSAELKKVNEKLESHATRMEQISGVYTTTINTLREQMKRLGRDGGDEQSAFMSRQAGDKAALFSCRQEAIELGMWLMATQNKNPELRQRTRRWIRERAGDLNFLPNVPQSFMNDISNPILNKEQYDRIREIWGKAGNRIAQDLSTDATPGSIFVHPEFSNTLIRNVEEHGAFRRNALVWPMGSDTVFIPRRKGGITVKWEGEAESTTSSDPTFDVLGMTAKKMMLMHKWSSEIVEDAAIQIASIFMFEYALAIALEEDRIGFNGDGTGGNSPGFAGFVGVLGAAANGTEATADSLCVPHLVTGAAGANLADEITMKKLREMISRLHTWADPGAKWYMHRSLLAVLTGLETTQGYPVVDFKNGTVASIMGYPVEKVDQMPKVTDISASEKCLALGDLRKSCTLGDRRRVTVETSEHFAFDTDQVTTRLTARQSFLMQQGNGLVVYQTGTA